MELGAADLATGRWVWTAALLHFLVLPLPDVGLILLRRVAEL